MYKLITEVLVGETILDGGNRTKVTKVDISPNSCKSKVHINDKDCYEAATEVRVQD